MDELLTVVEVAKILKQHPKTVYEKIKAGKIVAYTPDGMVRVSKSHLKAYILGRPQVEPVEGGVDG